jgi:DNA-binding MarR family transcriptional regulator
MPTTTAQADILTQAARLTRALSRLRRAVNPQVRARTQRERLPEAQVDVLRAVADAESPRVQDVADRLRLAPNTVSTLVSALIDRGLIARHVDPDDRRAARLALTATARRRIDTWRAHRADVVAEHIAHLSADEQRALHNALPALEHLVDSLEAQS